MVRELHELARAGVESVAFGVEPFHPRTSVLFAVSLPSPVVPTAAKEATVIKRARLSHIAAMSARVIHSIANPTNRIKRVTRKKTSNLEIARGWAFLFGVEL